MSEICRVMGLDKGKYSKLMKSFDKGSFETRLEVSFISTFAREVWLLLICSGNYEMF